MATRKRNLATISNYKDLFTSPLGKKVLLDLCREHRVFDYYPDVDPHSLAMLQGERNVINRILAMLRINVTELNEQYEAEERLEKMEG